MSDSSEAAAPPRGRLFTDVYLDKGAPLADSEVFRRRLGAYLHQHHHKDAWKYRQFVETETGKKIRMGGSYVYLEEAFEEIPIARALNLITLTWRFLRDQNPHWVRVGSKLENQSLEAQNWLLFVSRTLREENVGYTVDLAGGVHYLVDHEFSNNRASTLSCLDRSRYVAVLDAFQAAHRHLDSQPQDTKAAVRSLFESLEILVKLFIETKNLNKWLVENKLKPMALAKCGDEVEAKAVTGIYDGFAQWVDGIHWYRHGQPVEEPSAPSPEFAVYVLSSGAAYLRMLAALDPTQPARVP